MYSHVHHGLQRFWKDPWIDRDRNEPALQASYNNTTGDLWFKRLRVFYPEVSSAGRV